MQIPQFPQNPLFFSHKYLQNIILWFSLLRSVSHSRGLQGSAEPIFFARTVWTHCLSERFGQTDPNRHVSRSLEFTYCWWEMVVVPKYHCNAIICPRCYRDEYEVGHINVLIKSAYFRDTPIGKSIDLMIGLKS